MISILKLPGHPNHPANTQFVTSLESTPAEFPVSVDSKAFTENLTALQSTLTKKGGRRGESYC